jgi:hypothetical protein
MHMRDKLKYFPVNWVDGMKIGKHHFIAQDNAWQNSLQDVSSLLVSPIRYGILPSSIAGEENCDIRINIDNQNTIRVSVLQLQAVTQGGIRVSIPTLTGIDQQSRDGVPGSSFTFNNAEKEPVWWVVLVMNPYEKRPAGSPDMEENPPRLPFVVPTYSIALVSDSQFRQYEGNPYALTVGKILAGNNEVRIDDEYIPPCFSVSSHADLMALYMELDKFLGTIELKSAQIVQTIYKKNQQNDISELVLFLCDRVILYLGQIITQMRWQQMHDAPAGLFANIAGLSRVMKNTIDMRIGSGKDEMLNYMSEWCELKQGELEQLLVSLAFLRYDHNDINSNIQKIINFVKVTTRLFETLSKLDFIGKKKDSGIFVKEEQDPSSESAAKARRRFFG